MPTTRPRALLPFLALLLCGLAAPQAQARAWTKPPGSGYAKLGSATFLSSFAYDDEGVRAPSEPFLLRAQTLYVYGELGVAKNLTLTGYAPWVVATNQHTTEGIAFTTYGPGDASLGAILGLVQGGPVVLSLKLDVKLPLYEGEPSVRGLQTRKVPGFPRSAGLFPAQGDGQVDVTSLIALGGALPFLDGFFAFDGGYRFRAGAVTDAFVVGGTGGVFLLGRRLLVLVDATSIMTLPSADPAAEVVGKGYVSGGPGFMYFLTDGLALEAGLQVVARGVNAAGGFSALSGVSYAF